MKQMLLIFFTIVFQTLSFAQCGNRYIQEIFPTVTTTSNIQYGSALDYQGNSTNLSLDFYEPQGDTQAERPLIIWIHGGTFVSGTKTDLDMVELSQRFTKRGYVCASIDYRLGGDIFGNLKLELSKAGIRALQDAKAAIRFFRNDYINNGNSYGIDTSQIIIGGTSAGGVTALHVAFLNDTAEGDFDLQTAISAVGGLEGITGNSGFSTNTIGVLNLAGAIGDTTYMNDNLNKFVFSVHADMDGTVPYESGFFKEPFLNTPVLFVYGSKSIQTHATFLGMPNDLYTYSGTNHPVHITQDLMDTTINFISRKLVTQLKCYDGISLAINTVSNSTVDFNIFPNPASDFINIKLDNSKNTLLQIFDMRAKLIYENEHTHLIKLNNLDKGIYLVRLLSVESNEILGTKKFVLQ